MERMSTYNSSCLYGSDEMSLSDSNGTLYVWAGRNLGGVLPQFMNHVEETKAGISPSLLKGSPTELVKHRCNT